MPVSVSSQIINYLVKALGYGDHMVRAQEVKLNGVLKSVHHPFKTYQLPFLSPQFPEATSSPHLNAISQKDKTSDAQVSHFAVALLPMWPMGRDPTKVLCLTQPCERAL